MPGSVDQLRREEEPSVPSETAALRRRVRELEAELASRGDGRLRWEAAPPLSRLWPTIEARMGLLPAFFEQAQSPPAVPWALWGLAEFAYLDSPLPSLFKEQLFTYLSRFCLVRYCLARHCGFLLGSGNVAGDPHCPPMTAAQARGLLEDPMPAPAEQMVFLDRLTAHPGQLASWPNYDDPLGKEFFFGCAAVLLHPDRTSAHLGQLRRLLGPERVEQLLLFLGFIRMAHFWTEVHPSLSFEPDLERLIQDEAELSEPLLHRHPTDSALRVSLAGVNANRETQDQQLRFQALVAATAQVVWTTDADGLVREDSPSWRAFTGQSLEEWQGEGWLNAIHPDDRERTIAAWRQSLETKSPYCIEYRLRHVSGAWRWTAARAHPLNTPEGGLAGWVGLNIDITRLKNAEAAAKESEERFRLLVQGTRNTAIFALDAEGCVQSWNSGAARITGYEADEVLGKSFAMFFPESDRADARPAKLLAAASREEEVEDRSWRVRKNGERFWADVTITARRGDNGALRGFTDILRDLTEERRYLTALEESEERSRLLLDNAAQGILGVRSDGAIEFVNSTALSLFGYTSDELIGQPIELLLPESCRAGHVTHRQEYGRNPDSRPMGLGRELAGLRKSGEVFPVEVTLSYLRTSQGTLHLAFVSDITQRQQDKQALNESLERFRLLSEKVPQLVWTCQPDGSCDYLNERWVEYTGIPAAAQLGYGWLQRIHPEDREAALSAWRAAVAGSAEMDVEFRIRRHDGAYRWFRTRASALHNREGEVVKWFGTNTDIHDLRMAMKELEAANADLESFAYIAAHDLQEPLRTVSSFTQLLERHLDGRLDERGLILMGHVRSGARRMSDLFSDLLHYTEAGFRSGADRGQEVDLGVCASLAVKNLADPIREAGATVDVGDLPKARGAEIHFVQLLQNLIGNAIKYAGMEPPVVKITSETGETHCRIRVADNGIGIEPEDQETIFKIFKRLHGAEKPGTGIGLAICQRLVNRYGGRIWVESAGKGRGSTFVFELPSRVTATESIRA